MKLLDSFLTMLNLNDDDDYEDDYFDEEEEGYEEPAPLRKSTPKKAKKIEKEIIEDRPAKVTPVKSSPKVTPIRQSKRTGGVNGMELRVIKPTSFDDARDITDTLLSGRAVVLNLEGLDIELAHRIMDFTFGSCYAINGNLRKVSNYILVITPPGVDISGDFQELFAGSLDVPSFGDDF